MVGLVVDIIPSDDAFLASCSRTADSKHQFPLKGNLQHLQYFTPLLGVREEGIPCDALVWSPWIRMIRLFVEEKKKQVLQSLLGIWTYKFSQER